MGNNVTLAWGNYSCLSLSQMKLSKLLKMRVPHKVLAIVLKSSTLPFRSSLSSNVSLYFLF